MCTAIPALAQTQPLNNATATFTSPQADEPGALPHVALTGQIVYQVLAAEVALQRNQPAPAYQTYLALARDTRDPRMAQHATEIALTAQSPADALSAAKLWRQYAPASNRAAQINAALLVLNGKPSEAAPILARELARVSPDTRGEAILALQALIGRGSDRVGGLTALQDLLKNDLNRPETQLALARQQLAVDDKSGALQSLQHTLQLKPDYLPAALMLSQMGPAERAIGITSFTDYLRQNPKSHDARLGLAQLYLADNRLDQAKEQFDLMSKRNTKDPVPFMALALINIQQKHFDEAVSYLQQYLQVAAKQPNTDLGQAYIYLAQIALEQQDDARAAQWLNRVDQTSLYYVTAQITHAQLLQKQGRFDEARQTLSNLQAVAPREAALIARTDASLLFATKRYKETEERLKQAVSDFPNDPDLRYDYAMAAEKNGRYPLMEKQLRLLINQQPDNPQAYNALGYSLTDRNERLPEARRLIEKAVSLAPANPFILDSLGWLKYRSADANGAAKILHRAYELQPNAEIGAHLGEVLWAIGKQDEARAAWRNAQALDPDNETLMQTLQRLRVNGL